MSKSIKKILSDKQLYIFLLIVLIFFGTFFRTSFSVDTYQLFGSDNMSYMSIYKEDSRLIHYFSLTLLNNLNLTATTIHTIIFLFAVIFTTFAIYFLNTTLNKYIKNKFISALVSTIVIINPFSIELWLFTEMAIMELSILSCVLAFKNFDTFLEKKERKNFWFTILFMFIALFSYQGTIAIFIALSAISIVKYSNKFTSFIKNNILLGICYSIPTLSNFLIAKIMGTNRLNVGSNFIETINFITKPAIETLLNAFWILPAGIFILFVVGTLALSISSIALKENKHTEKAKLLLRIILCCIYDVLFYSTSNVCTRFKFLCVIPKVNIRIWKYYRNYFSIYIN